jgi:hypothetical protein
MERWSDGELESAFDKGLYFLGNARDLTAIPPKLGEEPAIVKAFDIANVARFPPKELEWHDQSEWYIQNLPRR